ncbi:MAG: hypothetical protein WD845_00645 [Pirellulales bacterium]
MKRARILPRIVALACLALVLGAATIAEACPSCQQALSDGSQGDLARGIYYSVLFMMATPFAIVGTFGFLAYRVVKREQRRLADEAQRNAGDDE